jgi:hypothetical protein
VRPRARYSAGWEVDHESFKNRQAAHDNTVAAADAVMQTAVAVATTQAQQTAAAVVFYRAVLASAITNGLDQGPFIFAIQSLGKTV